VCGFVEPDRGRFFARPSCDRRKLLLRAAAHDAARRGNPDVVPIVDRNRIRLRRGNRVEPPPIERANPPYVITHTDPSGAACTLGT
jgi:hypothetical protein